MIKVNKVREINIHHGEGKREGREIYDSETSSQFANCCLQETSVVPSVGPSACLTQAKVFLAAAHQFHIT